MLRESNLTLGKTIALGKLIKQIKIQAEKLKQEQ